MAVSPTMSIAQMRSFISERHRGPDGECILRALDALVSDINALNARCDLITAWGAALATKLNADAGVTDTNYDTTPES